MEEEKRIVSFEGINDYDESIFKDGVKLKSYDTWREMLRRCYSPKLQSRCNTYIGCEVCDEWKYFTNFKEWFDENYKNGYELDKDILKKNNKLYSPYTCCFVPHEINMLLAKRNAKRGNYPIGVGYSKSKGKIRAYMTKRGVFAHLGYYETIIEAFNAYKQAKEEHLQEIAKEYFSKGLISALAYDALMSYQVEISD